MIPSVQLRPLPPSPANVKEVFPLQLVFPSLRRDRGLVIDRNRIWVNRGKPGSVEIEDLEKPP